MARKTELAWAAGFFDGEGTIEQIARAVAAIEARPELPRVLKKRRICGLQAQGLTTSEIAQAVGLSRRTVNYHLQTAGEGVK